jgi:hypothetical protein
MCGYLLQGDDGADADAPTDDGSLGQKGRVRQRTISLSEDERDEIKEKIAESDSPFTDPEEEVYEEPVEHEEIDDLADPPLADFGDDMGEEEEVHPVIDELEDSDEPEYLDDDLDVGFEEADADFEAEMRARREALEAELARRTSATADYEESEAEDEEEETAAEEDQEADAPAEPKKRRRRRRKKKKPQREESEVEEQAEAVEATPIEEPLAEVEPEADQIASVECVDQQEEQEAPVSAAQQEQGVQVSRGKQDGALVAWFVHYQDDENGTATEIREGRFFLGGSRLKESDIVIPHKSISTPHCLIKAEPSQGVHVQDLMSVNGTLVKKVGKDEWEPVPVPMQLDHGDWLKLGDYEVMVCVIPQQKEKE